MQFVHPAPIASCLQPSHRDRVHLFFIVNEIFNFVYDKTYQLAFLTPGICPLYASSRKQILQIPYFLKYACGRPHILQRLYSLVENFCLRCCFNFIAVLAMNHSSLNYFEKGMPNCVSSSLASSSVFAVVTTITSIPLTLSILSYSISGKMICSLIPRA